MNLRIWLLNIVLAGVLVFVGTGIWDTWQAGPRRIAAAGSSDKGVDRPRVPGKLGEHLLEEGKYEPLVSQNLFSPDRKEYIPPPEPEKPEKKEEEAVKKTVEISGEKVVLFGVIISDELKTAMINNPGGKLGEEPYLWIKEGQQLANLKVVEIHPRQLVLADENQKYEVLLSGKKEREERRRPAPERPGAAGPTVISAGSVPKPASASSATADTSAAAGEKAPAQKKTGPEAGGKKTSGSGKEEAEYKLIETPFGMIKQKIK